MVCAALARGSGAAAHSIAGIGLALLAFALLSLWKLDSLYKRSGALETLQDQHALNKFCLESCNNQTFRHPLCIITRVFNSAEWLPEWIEYNKLIGVSHIFIVDDCSRDQGLTRRVLSLYRSLGYVTFWEDLGPPLAPEVLHCNHTGRTPDEYKLFAFAFRQAKHAGCDWVAAIDIDEFISFDDGHAPQSVNSVLAAQTRPWYQLAWWVVSGNGLREKPQGLMIENFKGGYLDETHYKSIARSCVVADWAYSLWPTAFVSPACKQSAHLSLPWRLSGVHDLSGQLVSAAPMFLKHFIYRSLEEYMRGRGSMAHTSNNDRSPWFNNSKRWERGDTDYCGDRSCVHGKLGEKFTAGLVQSLRDRLGKRALPFEELRIKLERTPGNR